MVQVLYGSEIATKIKQELKEEVSSLVNSGKRIPCLCVILVGDNPASMSYVKGKEKACVEIGFKSKMITLDSDITQEELIDVIEENNIDDEVDGILVQLPLPKHINEREVIGHINPSKDVDGLHPLNIASLYASYEGFVPCTPLGIMEILDQGNVDLSGKHVVVVGRSILVGAPVSRLALNKNATVTICHSYTSNLEEITSQADILIVCVGKAEMIKANHIKEGAVVIDVGVNRKDNGKLCGDVDFEDVKDKCSIITPVPRGVGPMTICMLLKNTLKAYYIKEN